MSATTFREFSSIPPLKKKLILLKPLHNSYSTLPVPLPSPLFFIIIMNAMVTLHILWFGQNLYTCTQNVAAMHIDSCFGLVWPHQHGIAKHMHGPHIITLTPLLTQEEYLKVALNSSPIQSIWKLWLGLYNNLSNDGLFTLLHLIA